MDLFYELGSQQAPKGHALVYCRSAQDPSEVYATYVVVPPISIDLTKYLPPMIVSQFPVGNISAGTSAVPLPPVLERVDSYESLRHTAELRNDDLLFAGSIDPNALPGVLSLIQEVAQTYSAHYTSYNATLPQEASPKLNVSEVLYGLMSEAELVRELAKLTGQLRYAVEGNDTRLTEETVNEISQLARYMPPKYRVDELITAGKIRGEKGTKLAELYVERCYKIAAEQYREVQEIDQRINELQAL